MLILYPDFSNEAVFLQGMFMNTAITFFLLSFRRRKKKKCRCGIWIAQRSPDSRSDQIEIGNRIVDLVSQQIDRSNFQFFDLPKNILIEDAHSSHAAHWSIIRNHLEGDSCKAISRRCRKCKSCLWKGKVSGFTSAGTWRIFDYCCDIWLLTKWVSL